jgi:hypothetical protein
MASETSVLLSRNVISLNRGFIFGILFMLYFGALERKSEKIVS